MKEIKHICDIDVETYSTCDIKAGSFKYAQDKSTEILCLAYSFDQKEIKLWHPDLPPPQDFLDHISSGGLIRSFNVTFEYAILNYVCTRLHNWPHIKREQTLCIQLDCLTLALPSSLKNVSEVLGLEAEKDKEGKRLITKLCKPRKPTKAKTYTRVTKDIDPESFDNLYKYCVQDVAVQIEIYNAIPRHVKGKELDLFHLTLKINETGLNIDVELVKAIMRDKAEYELKLNEEVLNISGLVSTNSRPQSLKWLKENGIELEGYTKKDIKDALLIENLDPKVRRFLEIRSELSRTPIKKYDFIIKALCSDNTVKNNIIMNKSTTGRYASQGMQMQNLPRDAAENPEELILKFKNREIIGTRNIYNEGIKLIRNSICASDGYKLVVSDFSGIELRVSSYLAGDKKTVNDFKKGIDQYKTMAASIFNVKYSDVTKEQRTLGKIAILGGQYGAGKNSFHKICTEGWGLDLTEQESGDIIDGFRETYHHVVSHWYGGLNAAKEAVLSNCVTTYKRSKFRVMGDFLYMRLPSSKLLAYYRPKIIRGTTPWGSETDLLTFMGTNTYTRKWERLNILPGRLYENFIQGTAAEILKFAMTNVDKRGFSIVGCVHDEILAVVKKDSGLGIKELDEEMCKNPDWCLDLPLDSEGFEGAFYKK